MVSGMGRAQAKEVGAHNSVDPAINRNGVRRRGIASLILFLDDL